MNRMFPRLACFMLALALSAPLAAAQESRYHAVQKQADALYEAGKYQDAMKQYLALAKKGDSFSQYRVSYMYLEGLGTEADLIEAYAWAYLSAQNYHKQLVDYRNTVGSFVPEEQHRKALRRVDYYMRKWGNEAVAEDAMRGAKAAMRSCTGSRLGTKCDMVYVAEMPTFWAYTPGGGNSARAGALSGAVEGDGGGAAPSGSVSSAQTGGAGGAVRDFTYYEELRARIRELDQYLGDENTGQVEVRDLEMGEDQGNATEEADEGR